MKKLTLMIACAGLISATSFAQEAKKQEPTKAQAAPKQAESAKPVQAAKPQAATATVAPAKNEAQVEPKTAETKKAGGKERPAPGKSAGTAKEKPATPATEKK